MIRECIYNHLTGEEPTLEDCGKCHEKFELPYENCCLISCDDCCADDCFRKDKEEIEVEEEEE